MLSLSKIKTEFLIGTDIEYAIDVSLMLARNCVINVEFSFNGYEMFIYYAVTDKQYYLDLYHDWCKAKTYDRLDFC